ncbi:MAG: 4Fe-4S ferredoxin, partial [Desulfocapsaceae bacterium]
LAPGLLYFTRPWSLRILQILLILSAIEWIRTLLNLVQIRQDLGMDWTRLAIILGSVAIFTAASALIFQHVEIRKKYGLERSE